MRFSLDLHRWPVPPPLAPPSPASPVWLVQTGVLYAWLVNGAGGCILIAILAHAGFKVAVSLVPRSTVGDLIACLGITAATVAVVAATKGRLRYASID